MTCLGSFAMSTNTQIVVIMERIRAIRDMMNPILAGFIGARFLPMDEITSPGMAFMIPKKGYQKKVMLIRLKINPMRPNTLRPQGTRAWS